MVCQTTSNFEKDFVFVRLRKVATPDPVVGDRVQVWSSGEWLPGRVTYVGKVSQHTRVGVRTDEGRNLALRVEEVYTEDARTHLDPGVVAHVPLVRASGPRLLTEGFVHLMGRVEESVGERERAERR
jgi:hypothetical protein